MSSVLNQIWKCPQIACRKCQILSPLCSPKSLRQMPAHITHFQIQDLTHFGELPHQYLSGSNWKYSLQVIIRSRVLGGGLGVLKDILCVRLFLFRPQQSFSPVADYFMRLHPPTIAWNCCALSHHLPNSVMDSPALEPFFCCTFFLTKHVIQSTKRSYHFLWWHYRYSMERASDHGKDGLHLLGIIVRSNRPDHTRGGKPGV